MPIDSVDTNEANVRFRPSRIEGIHHVDEVRISTQSLEIHADGQCFVFPFITLATGREISSGRVPVGELHYSDVRYTDSHIVFYTTPRITIFMPEHAPTSYPDSHFWKIQELLSEGGFMLYRNGPPEHPPTLLHPRPFRTIAYLILIFSFAWFFTLIGLAPEPIGDKWRGFLFRNPHNPAVGLSFTFPMLAAPAMLAFRHARTKLSVLMIITASYGLTLVSAWALWRTVKSWHEFDSLKVGISHWSLFQFTVGFFLVAVSAFAGWSGRRGFMEPILSDDNDRDMASE